MPSQQKTPKVAGRRRPGAGCTEAILEAANTYIVQHYPFGCLGGQPHRLILKTGDLWIVPIVLTSPGYGPVGEVGLVGVETQTHQVVGGSHRLEVADRIKRLKETKGDELEAAFRLARTV